MAGVTQPASDAVGLKLRPWLRLDTVIFPHECPYPCGYIVVM